MLASVMRASKNWSPFPAPDGRHFLTVRIIEGNNWELFLADMAEFSKMNAVYERMFAGHKPARTTVQVPALPHPALRVEIDAIGYAP